MYFLDLLLLQSCSFHEFFFFTFFCKAKTQRLQWATHCLQGRVDTWICKFCQVCSLWVPMVQPSAKPPCETQDWRNTRGSDWTFSGKRCKPQAVETAGATTGILQQARRTDDAMQYADMLWEKAQNTCPLFFQTKSSAARIHKMPKKGVVFEIG